MSLLSLVLQLTIFLLLAQAFHLESPAFYRQVLPLMLGGALVNHFLPLRYRPAFFAVLSVVSVLMVLGLGAGGWLVGVGLAVIGLCHVPIPFRWRIALLLGVGTVLIAMRADWLPTAWPSVIWPILGSMFMFRLAIYLYDLNHHGPAEPGLVLSYFFLAPNVVFPLFPVVDFQTFRRTYYDRPALEIYQEGLRWIYRGFAHLVVYRVIYQHLALSPANVESTATLVQYLVANFGLYLRVSGQFHLIVGLLHLFGFRLPETHRFFYLASSVTDFWRRINIYWKDFMQKLVYLPVFFGLKRRGETTALVAATVAVMVVTWLLHSYQWFWLLGTWLLSPTDMLFWGVIGICLVLNTLAEQRRGRARAHTGASVPAPGQGWRAAMQTAGMFALMAFLWGLWTSPTFDDFRVLLGAVTFRAVDAAVIAGTLAAVAVIAFGARRFAWDVPSGVAGVRARHVAPAVPAALAAVWVLGEPPPMLDRIGSALAQLRLHRVVSRRAVSYVVDKSGVDHMPENVRAMLRDTRLGELNQYDAERLQRGYYERIVGVNRFDGELWQLYSRAERDRDWLQIGAGDDTVRRRDDALQWELMPLARTIVQGATYRTNRWGMRDRDYEPSPPPATRRIAVLGQSYVMGAGVSDGETFEAVIEDRLNREWSSRSGVRYESLNFAAPNYSLAQDAIVVESGRVAAFQPDVLVVVGHGVDLRQLGDYIWAESKAGRAGADPHIERWAREADLQTVFSNFEANRRLRPYQKELARWAFARIAAAARPGMLRIYALIPQPGDRVDPDAKAELLGAAKAAGFAVIDLERVYDGYDQRQLYVNEADHHPNVEGHRIIADRLYAELVRIEGVIGAAPPR